MLNQIKTRLIVSRWLYLSIVLVALGLIMTTTVVFAQTKGALVDLNTASQKELEGLKGVGPAMAKKIIAARPYSSVDDLSKSGIPAKTIEGIKPYVTVGKPAATLPAATQAPAAPATPPSPADVQKAPAKAATQAPAKLAPGQKVNINTATKEQLEALPEIGPVKAQAIIAGRPYAKIEDIMKVKGIKEKTFLKIKDSITVQ